MNSVSKTLCVKVKELWCDRSVITNTYGLIHCSLSIRCHRFENDDTSEGLESQKTETEQQQKQNSVKNVQNQNRLSTDSIKRNLENSS